MESPAVFHAGARSSPGLNVKRTATLSGHAGRSSTNGSVSRQAAAAMIASNNTKFLRALMVKKRLPNRNRNTRPRTVPCKTQVVPVQLDREPLGWLRERFLREFYPADIVGGIVIESAHPGLLVDGKRPLIGSRQQKQCVGTGRDGEPADIERFIGRNVRRVIGAGAPYLAVRHQCAPDRAATHARTAVVDPDIGAVHGRACS